MSDLQIIGLCISMFFLGCLFCATLEFIICVLYEQNKRKKLIVNYLKNNSTSKFPYMLIYKYLTFEEKEEILKKVGNK